MSIADPDAAVQGYVRAATTSGHYNICSTEKRPSRLFMPTEYMLKKKRRKRKQLLLLISRGMLMIQCLLIKFNNIF